MKNHIQGCDDYRFKCDIYNEQFKRDRNMERHIDIETEGEVCEETHISLPFRPCSEQRIR